MNSPGPRRARPSMAVLFGQPDRLSTSYQTTQLTRALNPWFETKELRLRSPLSRRQLHQVERLVSNYLRPFFRPPITDYLLYANDGMADLTRWRTTTLLYCYDAPWDWAQTPPLRMQWLSWLRCRNLRCADRVFAVSETLMEMARALRPGRESSVHYLPVGVDCERFQSGRANAEAVRERFRLPRKTTVGYLGYLAAFGGRMAGEPLVEAAPGLISKHDLHFLVVGFGPALEPFRARVARLGLASRFTFTGYVENDLVPDCIAAMDICVDTLEPGFHSLARSETKLKQYMAMGRACVATAIGENCVDLDGGNCGVLVSPGATGLGEGIESLCRDGAARERFGGAARARALALYDWRSLARRMAEAVGVVAG